MAANEVLTLGSLIKKDLNEAYFLPAWPSTYSSKDYRFLNDKKYRVFDYPPPSQTFLEYQFPMRNLATAGSEVPILMDRQPDKNLTAHWKKWLPAFAPATIKTIEEGLSDNVPVVTTGAMQGMSENKHSVNPDTHYRLQLKSTIPEINVCSPPRINVSNLSFPCLMKIDQSWSGRGSVFLQGTTLFMFIALFFGIKMFIIRPTYIRFPKVKKRYDGLARTWAELPTDADLLSTLKKEWNSVIEDGTR
ncbi:predicted protein [Nematostella vectensis]|uniref:Uncharacterized protein n=1 Tax=Nematostella vectensis TaxID=45351 RepID=A7T5Q8_NEMVE|nr:predicted protein [Nematostella vectensis]|eukprot:XP_001620803.1 hypothetical protein NEMVEDRAFT_v1g222689 [Nematostella vectensis]